MKLEQALSELYAASERMSSDAAAIVLRLTGAAEVTVVVAVRTISHVRAASAAMSFEDLCEMERPGDLVAAVMEAIAGTVARIADGGERIN